MTKRNYVVSFDVSSRHTYHVPECNSAEEAESIAEEWFADGEEGDVDQTDINTIDVIAEDDESKDSEQ
jgi:hypothetical protein